MSTIKKGRGRPPGTGLNDHPTLRKVADLLLANPGMKPTTAMTRVLDKPERSTVRRLQAKWSTNGVTYLADAEARRAAERETNRRSLETTVRRRSVEAYRSSGGLGTALAAFDSPAMKAMQEMLNSPAMRAMRELQDSPVMRAMREMQDSPVMRAVRELHNSPAMRGLQEQMEQSRILSERLNFPKL